MRRLAPIFAAALLAGCGGSDDGKDANAPGGETSTAPRSSQTFQLDADRSGKPLFSTRLINARPGKVQLVMRNPSEMPHNVAIRGNGVDIKGQVVTNGGKSVAQASLDEGEYEFYCSVGDHAARGMKGKLVVSAEGETAPATSG